MNPKDHKQSLLDSLSTAVLLLTDTLTIAYLNPAAENMLAVSNQRFQGASASHLFGDCAARVTALREALANQHPYTERKATLVLPDLREITVDYAVTPLVYGGSDMLLLEIQAMDRILRIDREEALISASNTSRNLTRGLAHEIKNPLGGIRGASQLLAGELEGSELKEYTDIIITEVERLSNLVDRLLGPSRPPKFSATNIHEVTERVAALVAAETRGAVDIVRDYDPSIPEIQGDQEQLIQAVLNVVRNAMQALESAGQLGNGGSITLRTRVLNHFTIGKARHRVVCRLDIIDNGPGIAEEISDRIFYPMISGRAEGSGLGLPIAQSAINLHQGLIEYVSEPGNTQFAIYLPVATPTSGDNHSGN